MRVFGATQVINSWKLGRRPATCIKPLCMGTSKLQTCYLGMAGWCEVLLWRWTLNIKNKDIAAVLQEGGANLHSTFLHGHLLDNLVLAASIACAHIQWQLGLHGSIWLPVRGQGTRRKGHRILNHLVRWYHIGLHRWACCIFHRRQHRLFKIATTALVLSSLLSCLLLHARAAKCYMAM